MKRRLALAAAALVVLAGCGTHLAAADPGPSTAASAAAEAPDTLTPEEIAAGGDGDWADAPPEDQVAFTDEDDVIISVPEDATLTQCGDPDEQMNKGIAGVRVTITNHGADVRHYDARVAYRDAGGARVDETSLNATVDPGETVKLRGGLTPTQEALLEPGFTCELRTVEAIEGDIPDDVIWWDAPSS